jgi:hypothetical protein
MKLQRRMQLLNSQSGGGGGGGGSSEPRDLSASDATYGYGATAGVEVGDIVIFGYNYRDSGAATPGVPPSTGTATIGTATTLYASSRYDTIGTSDGGISMYWAPVTGAGDLAFQVATNRITYHMVVPGYNTVVQNAIGGGNASTSPSATLTAEPTGPVLGFALGGGAADATPLSAVTAGFTEHQPYFESSVGGYQKWSASYTGSDQAFGYTCTASQVSAGGAFAFAIELGTA